MSNQKKEKILSVVNQYGGSDLQVFGSVARGEDKEDSDIDFLVSFPPGYDIFQQRLPLIAALEAIVGRHVDLVIKHEINRHIKDAILQEARDL